MTDADISESFHSFPCKYSKSQQIVENFQHHPKIEYPCQLKEKGIR